jgi:hypothetical protein
MGSTKKPPRDHHYVPQLLLRRFVNADGKLWIYDLKQERMFPSNPTDAGFVKDLYSRKAQDGTVDHAHIEQLLSTRVEGPGDAAIRRLLNRETLEADWNDFLIFIAAQLVRTPAHFERTANLMQPLMQETFERMANHSQEFRDRVRDSANARGESEEGFEKVFTEIREGRWKINPTKDFVISMSLSQLYPYTEELRKMGWIIATLDDSDSDLIVGDHPVLLVVPEGDHVGLRHPEIDVILPLSSRVVAIGSWDRKPSYSVLKAGAVRLINGQTLRFAQRFVFGSFRSDDLMREAKTVYGKGPKVSVKNVRLGEKLVQVQEYK